MHRAEFAENLARGGNLLLYEFRRHGFCCKLEAVCAFLVARVFDPGLRMNYPLISKELRPIAEKVEAGQRISEADALDLYRSNDLNALGIIANVVRERKNGNYASYIHNRYINYSNICAAKKRDAHSFEYASDEIIRAVAEALPL